MHSSPLHPSYWPGEPGQLRTRPRHLTSPPEAAPMACRVHPAMGRDSIPRSAQRPPSLLPVWKALGLAGTFLR